MIRGLVIASAIAMATSAVFAADLAYKKPSPVAPVASAMCKETKGLPADAFGFATGSDVANVGDWGIALDTAAAFGTRGGRFSSYTPTVQVAGSFLPCLEVGPYLFGTFTRNNPYGGASGSSSSMGGGLEAKYKIFGRGAHGLGMTIAVSPGISRVSVSPGADGTITTNSARLLMDAELVKNRLYAAFNLEFTQSWSRSAGNTTNTSGANLRFALTTPVTDAIYLGAEISHQRAFNGAFINRYVANATYVGPTFLWAINDKWTLNGTWASQIAGSSKLSPGRALGIDNFNRHLARIKLGYAF